LAISTLTSGALPCGALIAYAAQGTLHAARDNVVLVSTWYTGTSKIMEQIYVGTGPVLDPAKDSIILANQWGSGLSTLPSNSATQGSAAFPGLSVRDGVNAQNRLITQAFGLAQRELVIGGSVGAGQALEWGCCFPGFAKRVAALASVGATRPPAMVIGKIVKDIQTSAPVYKGGAYGPGDVAAPLCQDALSGTNLVWCPDCLNRKGWEPFGHASLDAFLTDFRTGSFAPMDANNLLAQVTDCIAIQIGSSTASCREIFRPLSCRSWTSGTDTRWNCSHQTIHLTCRRICPPVT